MEVDAEKARKASVHLYYEMKMVLDLQEILCDENRRPKDKTIYNACLEALGVHLRVLYDVFLKAWVNKKLEREVLVKDDVLAKHYVCQEEWEDVCPQDPCKLGKLRDIITRIHKEFAHLTFTRQDRNPDDWVWNNDLEDIYQELTQAMKTFFDKTPKERLEQNADLDAIRERVQSEDLYPPSFQAPSTIKMTTASEGSLIVTEHDALNKFNLGIDDDHPQ